MRRARVRAPLHNDKRAIFEFSQSVTRGNQAQAYTFRDCPAHSGSAATLGSRWTETASCLNMRIICASGPPEPCHRHVGCMA